MTETTKRPIEELLAGEAIRTAMLPRADIPGYYPAWHGWVIMDAFLAGIDWARAQAASQPPETEG